MFKKPIVNVVLAAALFAGGLTTGVAVAAQPHMTNALRDLQAASNQLNMAVPDKAGHRVKAVGLVSQAIAEVQAGIAAAQ